MLRTIIIGKKVAGVTQLTQQMVMSGDKIVLVDEAGQAPKHITTKMVGKDLHIFADGTSEPSAILNDYSSFENSVQIQGLDQGGAYYDYAATSGGMELGSAPVAAPVAAATPVMSTSAWWGVGILAVAGGVAAAAGGGGGGSSTPAPAPVVTPTTTTLTATLVDSVVSGVSYTTSSGLSGVTAVDGSFNYKAGDIVTFKVGAAAIGTFNTTNMPADGIVMPQDIVGVDRTVTDDARVVNIAQFLQSLDTNNIATDGIVISSIEAAKIITAIDVQTATDIQLTTAIVQADPTNTLILAATAIANLDLVVNDNTAPTATITLSDYVLNSSETAVVSIVFSEAVTSFSNADVTAQNGVLGTFTTTDNVIWTATFTPTANLTPFDDSNVISLANTYTDVAGNVGFSASSANYSVDTLVVAPPALTVTVVDDEPMATANMDGTNSDGSTDANGADILYTFTFSDAVRDFTIADIVVTMQKTDGTVDYTYTAATDTNGVVFKTFEKISDNVYTLSVRPQAGYEGVMKVSIEGNNAKDSSGNSVDIVNVSTLSSLQTVDMRAPFPLDATHVTAVTPIQADPTYQRIILTFDENLEQVNQTAPGNFGVIINGDSWAVKSIGVSDNSVGMADNQVFLYFDSITNARGELFDWTTAGISVSYTDGTTDLTSVIHDLAGNDVTSFNDFNADALAPNALITIDDTILSSGNVAKMTVSFSEAVLSLDIGDFTVQNGFLENLATANGGKTWTADLKANADVDSTANIITLSTSYTDANGIAGLGATSSNYKVDTLAPIIQTPASDVIGHTTNGTITLHFNELLSNEFATNGMFYVTDGTPTPATDDGAALLEYAIKAVSISGQNVTLSINTSITDTPSATWILTYVDPTGNDVSALQDIYGSDVSSFTYSINTVL